MLFADHYARNWFSLWDTRWYAGFTVVSYPPLVHQLIALFIPFIGFDAAYAIILWCVVTLYPIGVYAFCRIFTGRVASSYAALASAVLLPIYYVAYVFGQLPFLTSTLFALFGAAALNRYLHKSNGYNLALAVSLAATTMAAHHATLLVQPFFIAAIVLSRINKQNWRKSLLHLSLFGAIALLAALVVIWPFWKWGMGQTMQTPIDHLSRHNFLTDPKAQVYFFWPLYGPLVVVIPFIFAKWPKRFHGLIMAFVGLFLLGLGGTTPLPLLIFGSNWQWLTYDRFTFWAALFLTPFLGSLLIILRRKARSSAELQVRIKWRHWVLNLVLFVFMVTSLGSWVIQIYFPTEPPAINMQPIVEFLNQDNRSQWRYLTFGFGQQYAYLNLLTTATTIDGSYHTARTLPELRNSGIAEIDTALWSSRGISAVDPILKKAGVYGVRWGFVNHREYNPELEMNGWLYRTTLSNGIAVWENPNSILPHPSEPPLPDRLASLSWGTLPLLSLIITSGLALFSCSRWQGSALRYDA